MADRTHARASRDAHRHAGAAALALVLVILAAGQAIAATPKSVAAPPITLTRTTTTVAVGSPIVVRGTLSVTHGRYTMRLQQRSGNRWTTVQTRSSSSR